MSSPSPSGPPATEPSVTPAAPAPSANAHPAPAGHGSEPHLHPEHFVLSPEVARLPAVLTRAFSSLGLLTGAIAGTLLYWAAGRPFAPAWMRQKSARIGLAMGLCLVFIAVGRWVSHEEADGDAGDRSAAALERALGGSAGKPPGEVDFESLGLGPKDIVTLAITQDAVEARRLTERLQAGVQAQENPQSAAAQLLAVVDDPDMPLSTVARAELQRVLAPIAKAQQAPPPEDSDPRAQELATLQRQNATLTAQLKRMDEREDQLEDELKEAREERGVMDFVKASVHDIGFGIGWSYVYFIGFLVLWKGHTPGKRLFGIRVLRIDGKPMTLWRSFERFHGYAASLVTGLLGFLQVLWDPSRQCLHDKVAETVVVKDRHHSTDAKVG
jgi:hypothetical protein